MKPIRLDSTPTRNRRLNEIIGMVVLVVATLLLLALASYTPTDPSFNTVGRYVSGRPAHNWTGMVGAYLSDAMLQLIGVAAFFLPLVLGRLGICWTRSRPAGSPLAKTVGLAMWIVFAPAAIALLPGAMLWRHSLPIEGTSGRLLADFLVHYLNLPGAAIVLTLMVAVSLYLATTFTFNTAREWATIRFGFVQRLWIWWVERRSRRAGVVAANEEIYGTKREQAEAKARRARELAEEADRKRMEPESTTLLSGLFGWLSRKKRVDPISLTPEEAAAAAPQPSIFQAMPRTLVDAPPVTAYSTAAAAVAPFAEVLAKAAAPVHALDDQSSFTDRGFRLDAEDARSGKSPTPIRLPKRVVEDPRGAFTPAPSTKPDGISFGRRADADIKPVTIVPKSVRGYKLPPSSLLYRNEEHTVVREEALREEARVLVEKSAEFGVDGQVTQINPGPVVTTFEFKPEAGVKVARITGLADDLCLAMAAESILIERMPGKSTVGIQVPNHERETIWLRDVVECESFAQSKSKLAIALGKDINGRIVTADLASMPHVLIAGS
ncbi:MAG: DNA translocase FtsK 4TM domain-containing protein, partial [Edaphobacter sp.]